MKNDIPTIHELKAKPRGELEVIFRRALTRAGDATLTPDQRTAALRTVENVRRVLHPSPGL